MYRDFLNFYFPLSTYFVWPFFKLTNWNLETEPILSLFIALLTLAILYQTTKKFLSPIGTSISLLFFSALFYYFTTGVQYSGEAITGLFLVLTVNRVLLLQKSVTKFRNIFLIGVLISLTLLFNQISALSLLVTAVFTLYIIYKHKDSARNLLILIAGISLPAVPVAFYFSQNSALIDLINNNLFYYLNYVKLAKGSGNLLSLPWNEILLFYTPAIIGIFLVFNKKLGLSRSVLLLLTLISIATIPSVVFSVFHRHHFLYGLPILAALIGLAVETGLKSKSTSVKIILGLAALFISYQLFSIQLPWYSKRIAEGKNNIANDTLPGDSMQETVNWIRENTNSKDTLLVAGDGLFYFKAGRLPSSKFFTVLPWHYKPLEQSAPLILANRPDYWIVSDSYLRRISSLDGWNSPEITSFIMQELKDCYKKTISFPDWEIWRKSCS